MNRYVGELAPDEKLCELLEKLNISAASDYKILKFFRAITSNYGVPDQLIMSDASFAALGKAFNSPGNDDF